MGQVLVKLERLCISQHPRRVPLLACQQCEHNGLSIERIGKH
ncbi:MAG: hypothetical protein U0894_06685 [Pirellulales bacterium]